MASASGKFNVRNPAVKRIMQEIRELQTESCPDFVADALEEDIFEWHFVIRGPPDTEFEGGIYHGRILLPAEYPFKPPAFMMLTPNGRFQTGTKICLSISSHHPEHWQPSWSVRTALTALIAFMPTPGQGAIGSLDFTKEERMQLAAKSRADVPKFGSAGRQKVIQEMHSRFLQQQAALAAAGASSSKGASVAGSKDSKDSSAAGAAAQDVQAAAQDQGAGAAQQDSSSDGGDGKPQQQQQQHEQQQPQLEPVFSRHAPQQQQQQQQQQLQQRSPQVSAGGSAELMSHLQHSALAAAAAPHHMQQQVPLQYQQARMMGAPALGPGAVSDLPGDRGLTFLIVVLSVAIAAMLLKKVVVAFGDVRHPML